MSMHMYIHTYVYRATAKVVTYMHKLHEHVPYMAKYLRKKNFCG